jgi:hypothetical protein
LHAYVRLQVAARNQGKPGVGHGRLRTVPQLPSPPVAESVVMRPERDADHPVIAEVVRAAFVRHPDEVASFVERTQRQWPYTCSWHFNL